MGEERITITIHGVPVTFIDKPGKGHGKFDKGDEVIYVGERISATQFVREIGKRMTPPSFGQTYKAIAKRFGSAPPRIGPVQKKEEVLSMAEMVRRKIVVEKSVKLEIDVRHEDVMGLGLVKVAVRAAYSTSAEQFRKHRASFAALRYRAHAVDMKQGRSTLYLVSSAEFERGINVLNRRLLGIGDLYKKDLELSFRGQFK